MESVKDGRRGGALLTTPPREHHPNPKKRLRFQGGVAVGLRLLRPLPYQIAGFG
jgi:hypothetical protein